MPQGGGREAMDFEPTLKLYAPPSQEADAGLPDPASDPSEQAGRQRRPGQNRNGSAEGQVPEDGTTRALRMARARVVFWRQQVETLRIRAGQSGSARELFATAQASLGHAMRLAADAEAMDRRRRLAAAESDLARKRRLLETGRGSADAVARAAGVVAALRAGQPPQ